MDACEMLTLVLCNANFIGVDSCHMTYCKNKAESPFRNPSCWGIFCAVL